MGHNFKEDAKVEEGQKWGDGCNGPSSHQAALGVQMNPLCVAGFFQEFLASIC